MPENTSAARESVPRRRRRPAAVSEVSPDPVAEAADAAVASPASVVPVVGLDAPGAAPAPLVALDPAGSPVVLHYDLPEPMSYRGRHVVELDVPVEWFKATFSLTREQVAYALSRAQTDLVVDPALFPGIVVPGDQLSRQAMREAFARVSVDHLFAQLQAGNRLLFVRETSEFVPAQGSSRPAEDLVEYRVQFVAGARRDTPMLLLVERYRLTSLPGRYGVGRTLKTFSLLPGERTKMRLSTYKRSTESRQSASSVLDSTSEETEQSLESSVQREASSQTATSQNREYHAEAEVEAEAKWGWGSARGKVSGGTSGGSTASREEFAKNVSNAVAHNAATASARREVHIDTSLDVKLETGDEEAVERELENINVSRTLNFVFRQMNQEFHTVLHLVDLRVAFFDGSAGSRDERPLAELEHLLERHVLAEYRDTVRDRILADLAEIRDHRGERHPTFVETVTAADPGNERDHQYRRVDPDYTTGYQPDLQRPPIQVPGLIMAADSHIMRTDGVVVDAFLGQGNALDDYSIGLQTQAVREQELTNHLRQLEIRRLQLANQILHDNDQDRAALYQRLFPRAQIVNQIDHAAISNTGTTSSNGRLTAATTT